jgi:hypothetical protein
MTYRPQQGMVEICAVLSTYLSEEDAFWAFRLLLEVLLPKYHEESIVDFQIDCLVLQELLEQHDRALADHLATTGVTIQVLCTKWFFSFFAESMPFDLVCRLYDVLLVDICSRKLSAKIIFSTATAVFLYLSEMLLEMHDPSVIVDVMCEFCLTTLSDFSVGETFVDLVLFVHDLVQDDEIKDLRKKYKAQLDKEARLRNPQSATAKVKSSKPRDRSGSSSSNSRSMRRVKSQSIKLIIQWKKVDDASGADATKAHRSNSASGSLADDAHHSEVQLEIVATPTENEVLAKVYQGLDKINRRRSRTSSLRSLNLLGSGSGGEGTPGASPYAARPLSLTGSIVESPRIGLSPRASSGEFDDDPTLLVSWDFLREIGDHDTVIRRSLHGVPDEHRHWVWPILIAQAPPPKNFPKVFPPRDDSDNTDLLEQEVVKAIENDISRTRNLKQDRYAPMRRVLQAFAARNRRVGYCQGMNEILAVLLQYLDERTALLALSLLIESVLPAYHVDSMIGLHTDCAVMDTLLRQNDPELHAQIQNTGLNMEILCTKWLVTCFLTSLPPFAGLKVMDMLLARVNEKQSGSRVLLGVGMAIFFTLRGALLNAKDAGEVLMAINEYFAQEMTKTTVEMDAFLAFGHHVIDQLKPEIVEEFRLVHKDEVMERFATFEAKKIEMRQQMEQVRAQNKALSSAPPSPAKSDLSSSSSSTISVRSSVKYKSNGAGSTSAALASYISKPSLLGGSSSSNKASNDDNPRDQFYQRVDVIEANRSYADDFAKMDEQLDDLADLFVRGKIDEKEHQCIKAQIIRKWCKGLNSPQSAMVRVQAVKSLFGRGGAGGASGLEASGSVDDNLDALPETRPRKKSGGVSLYGRMKNVKKSAMAIFKATFE